MLYLFSSGTLEVGGVEVPVPFFLIRHPEGDVVVDGGNPLAAAVDARAHWGALAEQFRVRMTEEQHCVAQLRELGIPPESVSHVVQSHLHIDHTGALGHFPDATVIVQVKSSMLLAPQIRPRPMDMFARTSSRPDSTGEQSKASWISSVTGRSAYSRRRATRRATCRCCFNLTRPAPSCSRRTPRITAANGMGSYGPALSIRATMPRARWNVFASSRVRPTRLSCSDTIRTTGRG